MKTAFLFFGIFITTLAYSQAPSPFDTLQVAQSDLTKVFIELDSKQIQQIEILNERTKGYVIAVFAEEKPGTKLFIARLEDIKRHRDYKLQQILTVDQFIAYDSKTAFISKSNITENR